MVWLVLTLLVLSLIAYAVGVHMRRQTMRAHMEYIRWQLMDKIKTDLTITRLLCEDGERMLQEMQPR